MRCASCRSSREHEELPEQASAPNHASRRVAQSCRWRRVSWCAGTPLCWMGRLTRISRRSTPLRCPSFNTPTRAPGWCSGAPTGREHPRRATLPRLASADNLPVLQATRSSRATTTTPVSECTIRHGHRALPGEHATRAQSRLDSQRYEGGCCWARHARSSLAGCPIRQRSPRGLPRVYRRAAVSQSPT